MERKQMNAHDALKYIHQELKDLIPLDSINLVFRMKNTDKITIELTVHYLLEKQSNFTIHLYDFNSNYSLEELVQQCKAEIATINPQTVTEITV